MEQIQLSISPAQMTKIRKGMPIQIKHESMGNGDVVVSLHPENAKKMMSAFKRGKGLRIQMDEDEVRASGLLGSLKKLGKKVEKGVVDVGNKVAKPTKNSAGQFIYFLEFLVNTSRYAVQINSYPLDTTIQSTNNYILPTGATWSVPATSTLSQFNINTTGFGEVLGYEIGSYPDTQVGSSTISFLSSKAPQVTPYSSILVSCNLVNNRAVIPSNILTSYTPLGTSIGSLFTFEPNYLQFADVEDGQYTQLVLEFRDQLSRPIVIRDPNMLITLYTETKK